VTSVPVAPRHRHWYRKLKGVISKVLAYAVVSAGAVTFTMPFVWMVATSLKSQHQLRTEPFVSLIPWPIVWRNYYDAWFGPVPFPRYFMNSLIITIVPVLANVMVSSLVAFAFARLRWPGRDLWFVLMLSTMMLPGVVTLIPKFVLFVKIKWVNTYLPFIVQAFFIPGGPVWVFLIRQFYMTIPLELDEAATVDGAGPFGIYSRIILPLSKPALVTVAIFSFESHWSDFMNAYLYLRNPELYPLTLGLFYFRREAATVWNLLMAATMLIVLPSVIVFFTAQRWFVEGVVMTGLK
jgi:ABC-type glycerol-3-phosphate transport system permease component